MIYRGLARDWGVSVTEAEATLKRWYDDRPEVLSWQRHIISQAEKTRYKIASTYSFHVIFAWFFPAYFKIAQFSTFSNTARFYRCFSWSRSFSYFHVARFLIGFYGIFFNVARVFRRFPICAAYLFQYHAVFTAFFNVALFFCVFQVT
jgi:hypothetical protein